MRSIILVLSLANAAFAEGPQITGEAETVFAWQKDRCETWDIPDGPARAWRSPDGTVHLLAAAERTRLATGPDLNRLSHHCAIPHAGMEADAPGRYDDRSWLASPHLGPDGRLVALAHVEFHAHRRPGLCVAGKYAACWWNSIVELTSQDGSSFTRAAGPEALVAALPAKMDKHQDHRTGYFNPSNIVTRDGFLYAFLFAEDAPPQKRGACLIRRPVDGNAKDWRAWDGHGFSVSFIDPYTNATADPAAHVCAPVDGVASTISSLVWLPERKLYLAVTPATLRKHNGVLTSGIWTITSPDLIRWSAAELLLEVPLLWRRDCAQDSAFAYPALLDDDSPSPNFETAGARFWLYLVRMKLGPDCKTGPERDLIRYPLSWPAPAAEENARPNGLPTPSDPEARPK